MPEPLIESIVDRVRRTILQTLNETRDGYNTILTRVFRALVLPGECADGYPYACVLTGDAQGQYGNPVMFIREPFKVNVYVFFYEEDLDRVDTIRNRIVADVKKCVLTDVHLRGGQTSASAGGIDGVLIDKGHYVGTTIYPIPADSPNIDGAVIQFEFDYIHAEDDPYAGR